MGFISSRRLSNVHYLLSATEFLLWSYEGRGHKALLNVFGMHPLCQADAKMDLLTLHCIVVVVPQEPR